MTLEQLIADVEVFHATDGKEAAKLYFRDTCLKLGHDWRVRNLYRVKDKLTAKALPFVPNPHQAHYLDGRSGRDLILKSRQEGFTTLSGIRAVDMALWEQNVATGIMAHKQEVVKTIFEDIVKFTYRWFKADWKHLYDPTQKSDSSTTLAFQDDGLGRVLQSSMRVLFDFRGKTVHFLHVSEASFVQNKRLQGSLQAVPATGQIILESTANGMGNEFYRQYQNFKKMGAQSPYKAFFFPWWQFYPEDETDSKWVLAKDAVLTSYEHEELKPFLEKMHMSSRKIRHKIAWRRWCIEANCQGDEDVFEVEYPTNDRACFFAAAGCVFPEGMIEAQERSCVEPKKVGYLLSEGPGKLKLQPDRKGVTSVWEEPHPEHSYVIGADPAGGVGKDFAAAYVLDQKTGQMVARIWGQIEPSDFGVELHKLALYYNKAWICPEANNHGHVVLHVLKERGYGKVYRRRVLDGLTGQIATKLGFVTSNESKLVVTEKLKKALQSGDMKVLDKALVAEMTSFLQVSSETGRSVRREAPSGAHDDLVMAAAFTIEMHSARPLSNIAGEPLTASPGRFAEYDETGFPI